MELIITGSFPLCARVGWGKGNLFFFFRSRRPKNPQGFPAGGGSELRSNSSRKCGISNFFLSAVGGKGANKLPTKFAMSNLVGALGLEPRITRTPCAHVSHYTMPRLFTDCILAKFVTQ